MFGQANNQIRQWFSHATGKLDPVSRGWAVVMGGNIGRMALGLVASILIARALGPANFGVYAVLGATIAIVGVIADTGLTVTAVKRVSMCWPDHPNDARQRGRVAAWLRLGAALLVFLLTTILAIPIANRVLGLSGVSDGPFLFILAMIGMVAVALSSAVSTLLQATNHFGRLSAMNLVNAGLTTILAVVLAAIGRLNLITSLLILGAGTTLVSAAVGYRLLPGRWALWRFPAREDLRQEGMALFRFSRWLWLANLFTVLIMQLDVIMVNRLTTVAVAGLYGLALNLARKADVVNHSLYTALLPVASALKDRRAIRSYIQQSLIRSGLISLGLLALVPLAGLFIRVLYGPAFDAAAGLLQLLLLVVIIDALTLPVILVVFPLERPKLYAASMALQVGLLVLLAAWLIPVMGAPGAAVAKILARFSGFVLVVWRLRLWRVVTANGRD